MLEEACKGARGCSQVFFCKYNDPIYVKMEKLDIMIQLANDRNIDQVLLEFKEYATEVDVDFVRRVSWPCPNHNAVFSSVRVFLCVLILHCLPFPKCLVLRRKARFSWTFDFNMMVGLVIECSRWPRPEWRRLTCCYHLT